MSCRGWVLHQDAVRCAVASMRSITASGTGCGRKARQLCRPTSSRFRVTATGRALLSLLREPDRAAVLRKAVFERHTPSTLLSVASVEEEIARSQHRGWFESAAEFSPDLGGVAMALPLEQRQLAVLVGGPMFRVQPVDAQIAALMQQEVARQVELAAVPSAGA